MADLSGSAAIWWDHMGYGMAGVAGLWLGFSWVFSKMGFTIAKELEQ